MIEKIKLNFFPCQKNKYKPKILETKFLVWCLIFLLFLKIIAIPFYIYFPKSIFFAQISKSVLISLTNEKRKENGLPLLKENPILNETAFLKANDMLQKGYFSHKSPEGLSPWYWLKKTGYDFKIAGENLAIGFLDSEEVIKGWYNSPSHRANFLNRDYQDIGIAVLTGNFQGNETTIVVQYFGAEKPQTPQGMTKDYYPSTTPQPKPTYPKKETPTTPQPEPTYPKEETPTTPQPKPTYSKEETPTTSPIQPAPSKIEPTIEIEPKNFKEKAELQFFNFLSLKYHKLIQIIIYFSLFFVIGSLLITIFFDIFIYRKFIIDYKDLLPKIILFVTLLIIFLLIDKEDLIFLIPHNFQIF
ncbi:MAG: CAP domain-containing protein [Patescibacteria group bacterium]|nr:CAP domain-containing protein [Patescibacteria group bacterium]